MKRVARIFLCGLLLCCQLPGTTAFGLPPQQTTGNKEAGADLQPQKAVNAPGTSAQGTSPAVVAVKTSAASTAVQTNGESLNFLAASPLSSSVPESGSLSNTSQKPVVQTKAQQTSANLTATSQTQQATFTMDFGVGGQLTIQKSASGPMRATLKAKEVYGVVTVFDGEITGYQQQSNSSVQISILVNNVTRTLQIRNDVGGYSPVLEITEKDSKGVSRNVSRQTWSYDTQTSKLRSKSFVQYAVDGTVMNDRSDWSSQGRLTLESQIISTSAGSRKSVIKNYEYDAYGSRTRILEDLVLTFPNRSELKLHTETDPISGESAVTVEAKTSQTSLIGSLQNAWRLFTDKPVCGEVVFGQLNGADVLIDFLSPNVQMIDASRSLPAQFAFGPDGYGVVETNGDTHTLKLYSGFGKVQTEWEVIRWEDTGAGAFSAVTAEGSTLTFSNTSQKCIERRAVISGEYGDGLRIKEYDLNASARQYQLSYDRFFLADGQTLIQEMHYSYWENNGVKNIEIKRMTLTDASGQSWRVEDKLEYWDDGTYIPQQRVRMTCLRNGEIYSQDTFWAMDWTEHNQMESDSGLLVGVWYSGGDYSSFTELKILKDRLEIVNGPIQIKGDARILVQRQDDRYLLRLYEGFESVPTRTRPKLSKEWVVKNWQSLGPWAFSATTIDDKTITVIQPRGNDSGPLYYIEQYSASSALYGAGHAERKYAFDPQANKFQMVYERFIPQDTSIAFTAQDAVSYYEGGVLIRREMTRMTLPDAEGAQRSVRLTYQYGADGSVTEKSLLITNLKDGSELYNGDLKDVVVNAEEGSGLFTELAGTTADGNWIVIGISEDSVELRQGVRINFGSNGYAAVEREAGRYILRFYQGGQKLGTEWAVTSWQDLGPISFSAVTREGKTMTVINPPAGRDAPQYIEQYPASSGFYGAGQMENKYTFDPLANKFRISYERFIPQDASIAFTAQDAVSYYEGGVLIRREITRTTLPDSKGVQRQVKLTNRYAADGSVTGAKLVVTNMKDGSTIYSGDLSGVATKTEDGTGVMMGISGTTAGGSWFLMKISRDTVEIQQGVRINFGSNGYAVLELVGNKISAVISLGTKKITLGEAVSWSRSSDGTTLKLVTVTGQNIELWSKGGSVGYSVTQTIPSAQYGAVKETLSYELFPRQNTFLQTSRKLLKNGLSFPLSEENWSYNAQGVMLTHRIIQRTVPDKKGVFFTLDATETVKNKKTETALSLISSAEKKPLFKDTLAGLQMTKENGTGLLTGLQGKISGSNVSVKIAIVNGKIEILRLPK